MEAKTLNEIHKQGIDALMIREAVITPKNENSGLKLILTNILRLLSHMGRKKPGRNFVPQFLSEEVHEGYGAKSPIDV